MMNSELKEMMEKEYQRGVMAGIKLMEERILLAAENGTPIAIHGRVYFIKTDLENLRDIMDDLEAEWEE